MKKLNLIFPVAGEASRFGGTFKPFLNIGDITFIDVTFEPFKKWSEYIDTVYFICTEKQEELFDVTEKMKKIISHKNVEIIKIKDKTPGPYQTIKQGIEIAGIKGDSIVCDCDHTLNVDNIFEKFISKEKFDAIIPTWKIGKDEHANWSKVVSDGDNVRMICEKEKVEGDRFLVEGIIGCILFNDIEKKFISETMIYVSDCLQFLLRGNKKLIRVEVDSADFYGDEPMLENYINKRRKQCTILCDIDGVLLKHKNHSTCNPDENLKLKGVEKINKWKADGHKVILTTARNNKYRECTINMLSELDINYDEIVMSLPAGPRILINDHKPSKKFVNQANAIELERNSGIENIDIDKYVKPNDVVIEKCFKGGSFAKTYLIGDVVRKHIEKTDENYIHYEKLKRQKDDLIRLDFLWKGCTPKIINEKDCEFDYYFDMEYLNDYDTIDNVTGFEKFDALDVLFSGMKEKIYSMKREVDGVEWLNNHFDKKIYSKFDLYSKNKTLKSLIYSNTVYINGKKYSGLQKILSSIDKRIVKPKHIRPVHGDFTFENIMWNGENIKLIDMDGSDSFDAAELDLGKMCQSVFSRFNEWKDIDDIFKGVSEDRKNFKCNGDYFEIKENSVYEIVMNRWSHILSDDKQTIRTKGIFYMCMYFIRFVPFRMKQSEGHGIFALIMAIVWLSKITGEKND
tara:strand:- start:1521 stop:3572 length:2052 start_codon:yes stop_codon:yes gene_type:complete